MNDADGQRWLTLPDERLMTEECVCVCVCMRRNVASVLRKNKKTQRTSPSSAIVVTERSERITFRYAFVCFCAREAAKQ